MVYGGESSTTSGGLYHDFIHDKGVTGLSRPYNSSRLSLISALTTFSDYHYHNGVINGICISCSFKAGVGSMSATRHPGLFMDNVLVYGDDWDDLCSRLSKN